LLRSARLGYGGRIKDTDRRSLHPKGGKVRFLRIIAAAWLTLCCAFAPARADKRIALVVGNAAYRHQGVPKLANPVNDARAMRDALKNLGFDVIYGEDLDLKGLHRVIGQFADRVGDGDVAMVYFAGHGATFGDTPYVVPVDAEFSSLSQVPYELVPVETLIGELRQAKGVRIVILDACRDNGAERELKRQASRGGGDVTRGLAPIRSPGGLIIAYATQYLSTAADDVGGAAGGLFSWMSSSTRHSPFTAALLSNIATPGLDVKDMFYKVGRDVLAATHGRQRPEISISMYDQYVLAPGSGGAPWPAAGNVADEMAWSIVRDTGSIEQLRRFIAQFPSSQRRREAEERIKRLEQTGTTAALATGPADEPNGAAQASAALPHSSAPPPPVMPVAEPPKQMVAVAPPVTPAVPADPCSGPVTAASLPSLCGAPLTAAQERRLKPKDTFQECGDCPQMVVVPAGSFTMGSPETEKGGGWRWEGPQHVVTISKPFAVGKVHVTVDQFAVFVRKTGHQASSTCFIHGGYIPKKRAVTNGSWRDPGIPQEGSHPVVCVSWDDATAYAEWLTKETGKPYRLLSEAEWEYAARGQTSPGTYPRFWFGDDEKDLCKYGNFGDLAYGISGPRACNDGYEFTSPAGHYLPNPFGLYDMLGNATQFVADCNHHSYDGAPSDGSAWRTGPLCSSSPVVRGGSWYNDPDHLRAAWRDTYSVGNFGGFRVARTLIHNSLSRGPASH
jgi:formylglycine-generating enzyme required for sulfatase activity